MNIGEPLRTIIVELLHSRLEAPAVGPEPLPEPLESAHDPEPVPATV